jgi:hypothetical protein
MCWLEVGVANGCLLMHPAKPLMDASLEMVKRLALSQRSYRGVVGAP